MIRFAQLDEEPMTKMTYFPHLMLFIVLVDNFPNALTSSF